MSTQTAYDNHATHHQYREFVETPYVYLQRLLLWKVIGDLTDKNVLDVGCGAGDMMQQILDRGARRISGTDLSEKQIEAAKARLGSSAAELVVTPLQEMELGKTFDIVFASFVCCYADSRADLRRMLSKIYDHLERGGTACGIVPNSEYVCSPQGFPNLTYKERAATHTDGCAMDAILCFGHGEVRVQNFNWDRTTYEAELKALGFEDVQCFNSSEVFTHCGDVNCGWDSNGWEDMVNATKQHAPALYFRARKPE